MFKPVHIFVGGSELMGWTEMSLSRTKDDLTGSLDVSIFMGYMPNAPLLVDATRGRPVNVYIGGNLAFSGFIDKRVGTGAKHGEPGTTKNDVDAPDTPGNRSVSIGPNEYTIKLSARGTLKILIDSSHQHPTTNMLNPTASQVVQTLVQPWGVMVEWLGTDVQLDKVRLRDGARVIDELHRIASENCYYMYETRTGSLRVTDDVGFTVGEPLVLGVNILSFSAQQSENTARAKIKVKGQRTKKDVHGKAAVTETFKEVEDQWVSNKSSITVQHYGDATPEALERRARFDANKRSSDSKQVTLEVFHVQSTSGLPWDVGSLHYVEIAPEGIFDIFECTNVTYTVQADKDLKTSLTLSPPPSAGLGMLGSALGSSGGSLGGLSAVAGGLTGAIGQFVGLGKSRRSAAGIQFAPNQYPAPWSGPNLLLMPLKLLGSVLGIGGVSMPQGINSTPLEVQATKIAPLTLSKSYTSPGVL